ncbi:MAG: Sensor kinase SpoOB-type, alpha-helical domain [Firmicutes bacterium]|nr:Sensor kinase SpoOB-type, alpha-helical domain [Bacillota bacterium]
MTSQVCSEVTTCVDVSKLLRIQRHDFLNHLQVIHAMIQLGRNEKALQYIEKLAHDPEMISNVLATYKNECK